MNFYRCNDCGQVIKKYIDNEKVVTCCNEPMMLLEPSLVEANDEVHQVHVRHVGNFVNIHLPNHPMKAVHHIAFITLKTNRNHQTIPIALNMKPEVTFVVDFEEHIESIYVYCSIHGLINLSLDGINKEIN